MRHAPRIPQEEVEAAILRALADGPATLTPLLARMRAAGYPEGMAAEAKAGKTLIALRKAGKIALRRVCTIERRSQTWELVP